ncbi:uncharacterized protein C8Q71DRAFT_751554 [Rhodofomes roseus]|uniref:RecQ-mediated genome instability protein 1 n=1 Tax=Rhodofomes roseus TaxID=34475 RepID=A0ABQ8KLN5_9APHY|nr:uncharacterized protein C8Q71DRAFT_751554 [Rhodofomes roseus]KAH9838497.1 hypothetical protein C8Q71DRAFT_751554 [Rhodofomes roseus]
MAPPVQVTQWLQRAYPRPRVDQDWLNECYAWVRDEYNFDPATQMDQIIHNVETQLLESDLRDSVVAGTGLSHLSSEVKETIIRGPVLVQVLSIMEIGQSAFSLMNVRQARLERADMAGLARAEDDEDDGPIPSYPRSMLRFELTDGSVTLPAVEYRRLPEFNLGESRLGFKMILKNVPVRRGIAFLEPKCVVMKGHHVADLEAFQDRNFARALRERMRYVPHDTSSSTDLTVRIYCSLPHDPALDNPEPQPQPQPEAVAPQAPAQAPPRNPERQAAPDTRSTQMRSPLRDLSEPPASPAAGPSGSNHDDDAGQPRRRKVPSRANRTPSPEPPARAAAAANVRSHYFHNAGPGASNPSAALARERLLSPNGRPPIFVPDSDEDESMEWQVAGARAREPPAPAVNGSSSDFDMGDEDYFNDEAILELADRVEREELALQSQSQGAGGRATASTSGSLAQTGSSGRTVVATASTLRTAVASTSGVAGPSANPRSGSESTTIRGSSLARGRAESSRPGTQRSAGLGIIASDVITIDDSDTDDKENVPVPTRHVRRRVRPPRSQDPGDIIELSD